MAAVAKRIKPNESLILNLQVIHNTYVYQSHHGYNIY